MNCSYFLFSLSQQKVHSYTTNVRCLIFLLLHSFFLFFPFFFFFLHHPLLEVYLSVLQDRQTLTNLLEEVWLFFSPIKAVRTEFTIGSANKDNIKFPLLINSP